MKRNGVVLGLALLSFAGGAVAAGGQSGSGLSADDEHACKVAMCMSNPSGPTAVAECVDSIEKLRRDLARGKAYPVCKFLGGGSGGGGGGPGGGGGGGGDPGPVIVQQQQQ